MRHAAEAAPAMPFDVRAMWNMGEAPWGYGEKAYRTWLDGAARMQTEATTFWSERVAKDMAALSALGKCTNPVELMNMQMSYARDAMADYYAESQRMMEWLREPMEELGVPMAGGRRFAHKGAEVPVGK
jgi:hypothetical protein